MKKSKQDKRSGLSLIEVVVATLIILILALGGAATLYQTGANIRVQGNKRIALELANERIEIARASYYHVIKPPVLVEDLADATHYLVRDPDGDPDRLQVQPAAATETITMDGIDYDMVTRVMRFRANKPDEQPDFESEHLWIQVSVSYRGGTDEQVAMETRLIPPEVVYNEE